MDDIQVSIVMPAFYSSKTIGMALQSIRNQTVKMDRIEILVIDGGVFRRY